MCLCLSDGMLNNVVVVRQELERGDRESDEDMARLVADLQKRMERTEVRTQNFVLKPKRKI